MRQERWSPWLLSAWIVLALGCHAHQAAQGTQSAESLPKSPRVSSPRPVRATPQGLFVPGGVGEVQRALRRHGEQAPESGELDQETQHALRRFQQRHQMAATGLPDYETVKRLGLDPAHVFLHQSAKR